VVIRRGEVWWADLGEPRGSAPALVRPGVIVSADPYNASAIRTIVGAAITSYRRLADAPGNVLLRTGDGGLPTSSVVNVTQLSTLDRSDLLELVGALPPERLELVDRGLRRSLSL